MKRTIATIVLLLAFLGVARFCIVILDEREQAFRTIFGDPRPDFLPFHEPVLTEPGWYFRIPVLHQFRLFDRRQKRYQGQIEEVRTTEKIPIQVDYYLIWRIVDPERYFLTFPVASRAVGQIDTITQGALNRVVGRHTLADLLSERRITIGDEIARESRKSLESSGVELVALQVRGVDYPNENLEGVFGRMRSERERKAKEQRAQGEEQARKIRAEADLKAEIVGSEASRDALRARGEGDAKAAEVYALAYGQDPEFYAFTRSLEAYRSALDNQTTLILSPKSPFLKYLFDESGRPATR